METCIQWQISVCMMLKTLSMEEKMPVGVGIWRMQDIALYVKVDSFLIEFLVFIPALMGKEGKAVKIGGCQVQFQSLVAPIQGNPKCTVHQRLVVQKLITKPKIHLVGCEGVQHQLIRRPAITHINLI